MHLYAETNSEAMLTAIIQDRFGHDSVIQLGTDDKGYTIRIHERSAYACEDEQRP